MKKNVKSNKLTIGEIAAYSLGSLGREFSNNCINAFFLVYLCIYQGLNPIVLTVAFVLAKLWDAVNDPMLATIVNNTKKSRFGRYRPWLLGGAIVNAIVIVAMFSPVSFENITLKYVYYLVAYVLWGMSFTVLDVPFWTMLPTIADSTDERNQASSMAKLIGGFGGFLVGMLGTSFILPMFAKQGMMKAYQYLGMATGLVLIVFLLITVVFVREKIDLPHENVGLKYILSTFKENDQLRAYAGSLIFFLTGTTIALNQILYLYTYCYEDGADYLPKAFSYTLFWVIACTGQGIAMMFYSWIVKKLPREKIYGISFLACIISYVLLFAIFFFLKPGNGDMKIYWLNTVLVALSGAFLMTASGLNQIGSTVMIADIVDYGEWKTGKRGDSVMFSVQTLILKFAGAIASLILGIGISVSGLPTVTDLPVIDAETGAVANVQLFTDEDDKYLVKDETVYKNLSEMEGIGEENLVKVAEDESIISTDGLTVLRAFMFLTPIPLTIVGYFIYKKKYWLYGEKYDKIKEEIDAKRKEEEKAAK
ncbi:MAG: MFS transporter [Clostridia bacterium]|nr:MFS transporter [Clostridia bacterium]